MLIVSILSSTSPRYQFISQGLFLNYLRSAQWRISEGWKREQEGHEAWNSGFRSQACLVLTNCYLQNRCWDRIWHACYLLRINTLANLTEVSGALSKFFWNDQSFLCFPQWSDVGSSRSVPLGRSWDKPWSCQLDTVCSYTPITGGNKSSFEGGWREGISATSDNELRF